MSCKYIQFVDFEYIAEGNAISENVKVIIYVKVIGLYKEYLGSFRFGLYHDWGGQTLKECISDVVSQNYPTYYDYTFEVIKK